MSILILMDHNRVRQRIGNMWKQKVGEQVGFGVCKPAI